MSESLLPRVQRLRDGCLARAETSTGSEKDRWLSKARSYNTVILMIKEEQN